jgi:hypothetical protein
MKLHRQQESAPKPTMSEAEAKKKARELQEQIRKRMKEKDEALEREREKEQLKGGKALADAKAKYEEANILREAEKRRKEKLETEKAMRAMEEQLRRDKEERFGKKFSSSGKPTTDKTPIQKAQQGIKIIKELYPDFKHPEVAENCFKLLKAYLSNVLKDPENEKFRKINKENKAFSEKVAKVEGGLYFLRAVGFEDENSFLVMKKVDAEVIKSALELLP